MKVAHRHRRLFGHRRRYRARARTPRLARGDQLRHQYRRRRESGGGVRQRHRRTGRCVRDTECRRLAHSRPDKCGSIDALVNNAGTTKVVPHDDLEGLTAEDFQRIFALNVIAPFQMVRACRDALKKAGGAMVNVSSVASVSAPAPRSPMPRPRRRSRR